jgi:hypothetical protein
MGVSKLPVNLNPERWELIFYIVRLMSLDISPVLEYLLMCLLAGRCYLPLGYHHLDLAPRLTVQCEVLEPSAASYCRQKSRRKRNRYQKQKV